MPAYPSLKAELEAKIAESERQDQADPTFYNGYNWWQLSDADQEVFDIEPEQWPRMMMTWHCFEAFTGVSHTPEFSNDLVAAARTAFPQWAPDQAKSQNGLTMFQAFAREFGGLTNRQAFATTRKQEALELRENVLRFEDGAKKHVQRPRRGVEARLMGKKVYLFPGGSRSSVARPA